ncbi:MAG: sugar ABC transporter permease [Thermomicrobiales bacterium]
MAVADIARPVAAGSRSWRSGRTADQTRWGYLMVAPMMIGFAIFFLIALVASLYLSLTDWKVIAAPNWVGLDNYVKLTQDTVFIEAVRNTAMLTVPNVILRLIFSMLLAIALNTKIRFRAFYRMLFFMPVLTMPVAIATIWKWLFDPGFGPINAQLGRMGLPKPEWLNQPETAAIAVVIVLLWSGVGYDMIIFLAGLQNIPREYYEAAQIDGAGTFRQFRDITLPLLTPTTFFLSVVAIIGSLQVFDLVYVMTRVGNINRFPTIVYYIYEEGFTNFRMGYAVSIAWVLLVIIMIFTMIQFWLQRRWVHYA